MYKIIQKDLDDEESWLRVVKNDIYLEVCRNLPYKQLDLKINMTKLYNRFVVTGVKIRKLNCCKAI